MPEPLANVRAARILVVEDERSSARLLEFLLQKEGYQVRLAEDGGQALAAVPEFAPDAVLLDLHLPDLSGVEVLQRLRADARLADLIVIALTASAPGESPAGVLEAGANRLCPKSIAPPTLVQNLRELGVPPQRAADPVLRDRLEIRSDLAELARVRSFVRAGWQHVPAPALDEVSRHRWELAVVEAVTNIIRHAYQGRPGQVQLTSEVYPDRLALILRHNGQPFEPAPGADETLDEPREGGMGLYLIRACTDEVRYSHEADGWSRIELIKRLESTNHPGVPGASAPDTPAT